MSLNSKMPGSLYNTTRGALLCIRVMGLLPLSGLTSPSSENLRYNLRSPYTAYYVLSLLGQVLMFLATINHIGQKGITLGNFTHSLFHGSSLLSVLILAKHSKGWPILMKNVEEIENQLPPFKKSFWNAVVVTTALIMVAATVEFILFVIYAVTAVYSCDPNNIFENYFKFLIPCIFDYIPYTAWLGAVAQIITIQASFIWSSNDLIMMLLSIYFTEYFLMHNERLKKSIHQVNFSCVKFRTEYLRIVNLVKLVNVKFSTLLMTAIVVNLHWICTQLFYALNKGHLRHFIICKFEESESSKAIYGVKPSTYFTYSLTYLVIRMVLELVLAARIHSTALAPMYILYAVPSYKYNIEKSYYRNTYCFIMLDN